MIKNGMNHKIMLLFVFLLMGSFLLGGCSGAREELNQKFIEGEQLLTEEKFSEAVDFFEELLELNQDNIKVMERLELSKEMLHSRENLEEAEAYFTKAKYSEAMLTLEEISANDPKGLERKGELLEMIKYSYLDESRSFMEAREYDRAIAVLDEYVDFAAEDVEVSDLRNAIENLKLIPVEEPEPVIKKIIVIDAGHQLVPDLGKEPLGPDSTIMKYRMAAGTQGIVTRLPEYILNLQIALKLKEKLITEGYEVVMIRETHDVSLSSKERSDIANASKAELFIRIHANGNSSSKIKGIETIYPSKDNPFVSFLSEASNKIAVLIHDEMIKTTGAESRGVLAVENMTDLNWSKIPVTLVETGYMTNPDEDKLLITGEYQDKLVQGMVNGINLYFQGN